MLKTDTLAFAAILLAASLVLPARSAGAGDEGWPRTIPHVAGDLTLEAKPETILSSAPSLTGILLSIGAPVVASAATTPSKISDPAGFHIQWADVAHDRKVEVLYRNLQFDIEAVIGWGPDLLVGSETGADRIIQHYPELKAQGVPTIIINYSTSSWQDTAMLLGRATGLEKQAAAVIREFDAYAAEAAASITPPDHPVSIVGYNLFGTFSIGRPESPQARLLNTLGFDVVGLPPELASLVTRRTEFEMISRENLSAAIAGETVFLFNGTEEDVEAFLADPLLANLPAVKKRQVYPMGLTSFRIDYYSGRETIDTVARYFR